MSSVRELEARNASDRKNLMQTIFHYLSQSGVQGRLIQEPALDSFGVAVMEPAIQLREQNIDTIHLIRTGSSSCGSDGEALRFQYKLHLGKELSAELVPGLKARTKTIKQGKVLGLFGGKIVGVNWIGQKLADILNQDAEISEVLLRCAQLWGDMEMNIDAVSSTEIYISGPWFVNPKTIIALYSPGRSYEEQNCVFGYRTIDRIARLIRERALNIIVENKGEINVTH